jgi:hypothetical protein
MLFANPVHADICNSFSSGQRKSLALSRAPIEKTSRFFSSGYPLFRHLGPEVQARSCKIAKEAALKNATAQIHGQVVSIIAIQSHTTYEIASMETLPIVSFWLFGC